MTPETSPERFTKDERALFDAGKCCRQTGFGLPGVAFCGKPRLDGFHLCRYHARELAGDRRPSAAQLRALEIHARGGGPGESWVEEQSPTHTNLAWYRHERTLDAMNRYGWTTPAGDGLTDSGEAALYLGRSK